MTSKYLSIYRDELLERVIPFWMNNSIDQKHGGFFTCLDRTGDVYDTDKFIWLQARQVWTFAMLYNELENKDVFLKTAIHGADFLIKHGRNKDGDWYFSLNQKGKPLVQAYNIFSDCFACMAFAQLYRATDRSEYAEIAETTFNRILQRKDNPKGIYNKSYPGTRELRNFSLPMILCNLCLELGDLLPTTQIQTTITECIELVNQSFYDPKSDLIVENINIDGSLSDSFDGRLLNPGHAIEAMWFLMDIGNKINDQELITTCKDRMLRMLDVGWDKEYGGIFYFLDRSGHPPQQLEWDQKLWWVHLETLEGLIKGYQYSGDKNCLNWFHKVHDYAWDKFPDPDYGEWYGYLNRRGEVSLQLKGGKWKGCFHVPRALFHCWKVLEQLEPS